MRFKHPQFLMEISEYPKERFGNMCSRLAEVLDSCMCAERGKGNGKTEMTFFHVPNKMDMHVVCVEMK